MNRRNLLRLRRHNIIKEKLDTKDIESYPIIIGKNSNQYVKNKKKYSKFKNKYLTGSRLIISIFALLVIIIFFFYFIFKREKKYAIKAIINKPILPTNIEEIAIKKYLRTKYNSSNLRFHYTDLYKNRTLFDINYSSLPYKNINKSLSFDEIAKNILESTGMLNMTLLNIYYYNKEIKRDKLNHIHVCMGMNGKYVLLSLIAISSLFNNSSPDTFIHFHALLIEFSYEDIKPIYSLQYINKNVEFIFYNAKQTEYDFSRGKREGRGVGDYTRVLAPEIVNNTNRIIILDSGDIIVNKDLSELYFFDMEDNYFVFSLEDIAGHFSYLHPFGRNNFYPNTGVCLVNIRKFREDNLYQKAFFASIAYNYLPCPYQDIFLMISNFKFKFWPLNYNCPQFYADEEQLKERKNDTRWIKDFMGLQKNSPFKYSFDEIFDAAADPVINHLYHTKPYSNSANENFMNKFREYANMSGYLKEIKKKYPKAFKNYSND